LDVFLCSSLRRCDIRRDDICLSFCYYFLTQAVFRGPTHVFESAMADRQQNQDYCG
jgi:hypothetical protein